MTTEKFDEPVTLVNIQPRPSAKAWGDWAERRQEIQRLSVAELWCVHVQGPDTLIAQPSKEAAEQRATEWNKRIVAIAAREPHPYDPQIECVATVWPWSDEGHALDLAKHNGEPEDICS